MDEKFCSWYRIELTLIVGITYLGSIVCEIVGIHMKLL